MALKDNIDGALDIKGDWSLKFYDTLDVAQIPQKCITYTNSKISSEENVKVWNLSKHLVSSTEKNSELTGISGKLVQQDGDSLKALYGNSVGKYQGVFLYVLMPDTGDEEIDPPGGRKGTIPKKPDPGKNEEVLKVPTNVTKMYYESASASNPKKITQETISRSDTYNIRKEEVAENEQYELKEWVIVTDVNPGTPENYPTWEEVEPNASPAEDTPKGDTPGNLGPKHWDVSQYAEKFVYRV